MTVSSWSPYLWVTPSIQDNRVRAISNALGLRPILWTTGPGGPFDTNDWHVAGGEQTAVDQFATFQGILGNASLMDTG